MGDDDRNDPLKHSRHKRSPKVWRLGQNAPRAIDPFGDEFRVAVFLSNRQADRAEREAVETGLGDLQAWCQATLRQIIDRLDAPGGSSGMFFPVVRHKPGVSAAELEAELGIPDDPAFLREWAGIDHPATALPGPTSAEAAEILDSIDRSIARAAEADGLAADDGLGEAPTFAPSRGEADLRSCVDFFIN